MRRVPEGPLSRAASPAQRARGALVEVRGVALRALGQSVLRVLARRGVNVDEATRARALECADRATLEAWLDRAATAEGAVEVLGEG